MIHSNNAQVQQNLCHEAVKPLSWLLGKWKSIKAEGSYPSIEKFSYYEEISFETLGQPLFNYVSRTWNSEKSRPMHMESGYLRIKPGTNEVALMVAHNFGLTSLEEGRITNQKLTMKSKQISRMSFAKDPAVTVIERIWELNSEGNLEITVFMGTTETPLTNHLNVVLQKM